MMFCALHKNHMDGVWWGSGGEEQERGISG